MCGEQQDIKLEKETRDHGGLLGQAKEFGLYPVGDQTSSTCLKRERRGQNCVPKKTTVAV